MYDLGRHVASIKQAIKAKQAPLKVAQTRLELRSHRPNGEATKDMPQVPTIYTISTHDIYSRYLLMISIHTICTHDIYSLSTAGATDPGGG